MSRQHYSQNSFPDEIWADQNASLDELNSDRSALKEAKTDDIIVLHLFFPRKPQSDTRIHMGQWQKNLLELQTHRPAWL